VPSRSSHGALTLEAALKIAAKVSKNVNCELYGRCFICGRTLTDEESIDRGIGPVCNERLAG
jgi:hypothetical protein